MRRYLCVSLSLVVLLAVGCKRLTPDQKAARFMDDGKAYIARHDYRRAILQFQNAGRLRKEDPEIYYQTALAFLGNGQIPDAVSHLQKTLTLSPQHIQARLRLGEILASSGVKVLEERARKQLETVLADSPQSTEALSVLALSEIELGDTGNAQKHLEEALAKAPQDVKAAGVIVSLKLATKDVPGALEVMKKAIEHAPQSLELAVLMGRVQWAANDTVAAKSELQRALGIQPQYGPALADLATLELLTGNADTADQLLRRLSSLPDPEYRPIHAMFLMRQKKFGEAIAELQKLAKADPADRRYRSLLTAALVSNNQGPAAAAILADAVKKSPNDTDALMQQGELAMRAGRFDEAEKALNVVMHFRPDLPEVHLALARVFRSRNQPAQQREQLQEALRLNPGLAAARVELSRLLLAANDAHAAIDVLDQAPPRQKNLPAMVAQRNDALFSMKNYAEVRKNVDAALKTAQTPDLMIQDALLKVNARDYNGGLSACEAVLEKDPSNLKALELLYGIYHEQNRVAEGLAKLQAYAAKAQGSAAVQYLVAKQTLDAGRRTEARQYLDAAKRADPKFVMVDLAMATVDMMDGKLDAVRMRANAILGADPKNVAALFLLGNVEDATGNQVAATDYYRKIIAIDGNNILALNNLAFHLASTPEGQNEAVQFAQKAMEIAPKNPDVQDTMGWVYYKSRLYDKAVGVLELAAASGKASEPKFHLALAYMKLGKTDRGRKLLQGIAEKDPAFLKNRDVVLLINDATR